MFWKQAKKVGALMKKKKRDTFVFPSTQQLALANMS